MTTRKGRPNKRLKSRDHNKIDDHRVYRGCLDKKKHASRSCVISAGKKFLATRDSRDSTAMGAYKCKFCKGWHLTSKVPEFPDEKFIRISANTASFDYNFDELRILIENIIEALLEKSTDYAYSN